MGVGAFLGLALTIAAAIYLWVRFGRGDLVWAALLFGGLGLVAAFGCIGNAIGSCIRRARGVRSSADIEEAPVVLANQAAGWVLASSLRQKTEAEPEGPTDGNCWFCGREPGDPKRAVSVPMHRKKLIWVEKKTASVPRCQSCYRAHKRVDRVAIAGMIIGAAITVAVAFWLRNTTTMALPIAIIGGMIFGAIGFYTARALGHARLRPQVRPHGDAHDAPVVVRLLEDGWELGAEPEKRQ